MPNALVTQHYPDDFQNAEELFVGAITSGTALIYADRDLVIDSIVIGVSVVGGSGATVKLAKTTTGTSASPASAAPASFTGGTDLHTAQSITATGTFIPSLTTPNLDTNLVKAGNWVGIVTGGTYGTPTVAVQIRYRSRVA
jgi:hypothetical protein